jgi:hypothetical protein
MERRVSWKLSCTVWSGGKDGDYIKILPIAIKALGHYYNFKSIRKFAPMGNNNLIEGKFFVRKYEGGHYGIEQYIGEDGDNLIFKRYGIEAVEHPRDPNLKFKIQNFKETNNPNALKINDEKTLLPNRAKSQNNFISKLGKLEFKNSIQRYNKAEFFRRSNEFNKSIVGRNTTTQAKLNGAFEATRTKWINQNIKYGQLKNNCKTFTVDILKQLYAS